MDLALLGRLLMAWALTWLNTRKSSASFFDLSSGGSASLDTSSVVAALCLVSDYAYSVDK